MVTLLEKRGVLLVYILFYVYFVCMKLYTEDKDKSGIYLIRNLINGKVYIGKAKCIYKRLKNHAGYLNLKSLRHENSHLINSWHKYGRRNFAYCVLEYLPLEEDLLSKKELEYIDLYDSLNPDKGYNKRYDSSTGLIVSEETRQKLSEAQIKRFSDPKEREKIGKASREFWKNNPEKLKEMSQKAANKIRKYKIAQLDYNTLEIIRIYDTRNQLKEENPDFYTQAILGCCHGNKNSYRGFKWKYQSIETGELIDK